MQIKHTRPKRPPIIIVDSEADVLTDLALATQSRAPEVSEMLLEELARSKSCRLDKIPTDVVRMMSHVDFEDEGSGALHSIQLVFPKDADSEAHRVSILTPIGAGLIGMRVGHTITWPNRAGEYRPLRILRVTQPTGDE